MHVACICGANGAGKSSLLEAIAWVIWGQGRAASEDDVIHQGEQEVMVDFVFCCHQQTYRIIRSRYRGQVSSLEFQIKTDAGFRSLTGRGVRATQQLILNHLKLDYETFVNSAYLRQGRADEFMLKRPSERKQILADLLKLDQYDQLAEQAKEQSRQLKAEISVLDQTLTQTAQQLQQVDAIATEQSLLETRLTQLQFQQDEASERLRQHQASQQQRQTWQQQLSLLQQQQQILRQDCRRMQHEQAVGQQQLQQLEATLAEAEAIATGYARWQQLQAEDEAQMAKQQQQQVASARCQQLQTQQTDIINRLQRQGQQIQAQIEAQQQQLQDIHHTLSGADEVATAVEQLQRARAALQRLEQLQVQVAPLVKRRQVLQQQIDRVQTRLTARLDELQSATQQLQLQQERQPQLQQAILDVAGQIEQLEKRRVYQQRVREKGLERRSFLERLQARQRDYEQQLGELEQKIQMLQQKQSDTGHRHERLLEQEGGTTSLSLLDTAPLPYPPCPLCDRPLDEPHLQLVLERHRAEQQELRDQIWVVREQLVVSEREIQVLRQEYRDLDQELAQYGPILERRGQLQEQLQATTDDQARLQQLAAEQVAVAQALDTHNYATELQEELRALDCSLEQLNYDDKNHALARGEADRWRWAEIKQAEIKQAQRRQAQIEVRQPELEQQLAAIEQQLKAEQTGPLQQQIDQLNHQIAAIGYDLKHHTELRLRLRQSQSWQLRHQDLLQAQQQYPAVQQRLRDLEQAWGDRHQSLQQILDEMAQLVTQLDQHPDPSVQIQALEQEIQQRRAQLDEHLAGLGRLQQQQQQLTQLQQQQLQQQQQQQTLRHQQRVYQELAQAFGKNGIQALMIENVLPQLEVEANQILGRLSAHQLHVQFVTQRAGRRRSSRQGNKLIDTLDILISDLQGTRPYETYSGGEAFRVNFAIRLALARLLAQRSGTALQMLIIDEGFGTQDQAGCDRLVSAIQAIAADFACILTVTHIPHLKEAFETRIEVHKTQDGSQLSLVM